MGFASLFGLLALVGIPIIIILYMLKPKHHDHVVPSTFLWQQVFDEIEAASRLHKLRQSLLMFLEILAVILFALMLAGLFRQSGKTAGHVTIVLDGSVTMQAEDVAPTRFDAAKEAALDYTDSLKEGTQVSLIFLGNVPELIIKEEKDRSLVRSLIHQQQVTDGRWSEELLQTTLKALAREGDHQVVYFGDRQIAGADSYVFVEDTRNYSVHDVITRHYKSTKSISVLTEVVNASGVDDEVMVSLYGDGQYITTKSVELKGESTMVFFDGVPETASRIRVEIDDKDVLAIDNTATAFVHETQMHRVAYVSEGNVFLEKILRTQDNLEVYKIDPAGIAALTDYDLYIYDGVTPEILPEDGSVLHINPQLDLNFGRIGYLEYPTLTIGDSPAAAYMDTVDFRLVSTQVFTPEKPFETVFETDLGPVVFIRDQGHRREGVIGFDVRYSDLPLSVSFPILMTGMFDALVDHTMTESGRVHIGDSLQIRIFPGTEKAWITGPTGAEMTLPIEGAVATFNLTDEIGAYSIYQQQGETLLEEAFYVNIPSDEATYNLTSEGVEGTVTYDTRESLRRWIGIGLFMVLLLNWLIYTYRRKHYAVKY